MVSLIREYRRRWNGFAPQLRSLYLFSGLQQVGLGAAQLTYVMRLDQLGWSEAAIAKLASVGMAAGALAALPLGLLTARVGYRRAVLAASIGLSLTAAMRAFVVRASVITAVSAIDGICTVALFTGYGPYLFRVAAPHERSHAYSLDFFLVSVCTPLGAFAAGLFLRQSATPLQGFFMARLQYLLAWSALLMVIAVLPLITAAVSEHQEEDRLTVTPSPPPSSLTTTAVQMFAVLTFAAAASQLQPVSIVYLGEALHLSATAIGYVNGLVALFGSAMVLLIPALVSRFGLPLTLTLAQMLSSLGLLAMARSLHLSASLIAYLAWAAAVQASGPLREWLTLELWPGRHHSIASACLNMVQNGGGAIGSAFGAAVSARSGFPGSLTLAAGLGLLSSAALLLTCSRSQK